LGRARSAAIVVTLVAGTALALAAMGSGRDVDGAPVPPSLPSTPAGALPVSVRIDMHHHGRPVPERFLGLSFEVSSLPQVAAFAGGGDFVGLLRSLGPGMLRFGGVSADTRVAWTDAATPRPAWTSSVLEAADLRRLGVLAARSDWRVLLTVGLAHYAPAAAAREVQVARRALGSRLAAVEIGNEPDAYARHGLRPLPWNAARYDAEVRRYRRAIRHLERGVPLAAPGVSGSHSFVRWARAVVRAQHPALLTGHHYPLGCHQEPAPSVEALLSGATRRLGALSLARYMAVSRHSRIPLRIDETNSVSCGGRAGLSNTFAAALWATDYISQAMTAGVAGINLQGNPANCLGYSPVCARSADRLARGALTALPVWYALLLTRQLVGDRPLRSSITSAGPANPVTAAAAPDPTTPAGQPNPTTPGQPNTVTAGAPNVAVRTLLAKDGSVHAVIVDSDPPGSPPLAVTLGVGRRFGAATVLSLAAASPEATEGVTLGGRAVQGDGSWRPESTLPSAPVTGGAVTVTIPPSSAALVTVAPKR
jgi:hypothetical protein